MRYEWKYVVEADQHQWVLKRNCALTPAQLGAWFGTLAAVSLLLAVLFAVQGAWPVIPFALIEVGALAAAFVWWGRHAGDYERIVASPGRLDVETSTGCRLERVERQLAWARVEYDGARRAPIRIVGGGDAIAVGRFVPDDRKAALARELNGVFASRSACVRVPG